LAEVPLDDEGHLRFVLDYLGHELEPSILIGGWATFARVGGDISRDIDLIIGSHEVREKVRGALSELSESSHLQGTKWRGEVEGVHVDVYIPHQSELGGKLRLRVEVLADHTEDLGQGKWRLLTIDAHTISKMAALLDRPDTEKGFKDAREILRLLETGVDASSACRILARASASPQEELVGYVDAAFDLLGPRSGANKKQREQIRRWRREWVTAITREVEARPQRGRPALA
jgi:hypothetical protein|tara:strand:+ start:65 stop:760 length:696 start_codon:yes stop_codon:yes gene_type:complete